MPTWGDAFTPRQLVALTTFSDLVQETSKLVKQHALTAGMTDDELGLDLGGTGTMAYADAVAVSVDGRIFIDGGVSSHVPLLPARDLGAQTMVVFDTGFP